MMQDTMRTQLLDAAEMHIRKNGYNAVSFRDLADQLGIKSASVHYHFRKKEDLGLALVARYGSGFFEALERNAKTARTEAEKLDAFVKTYRRALTGSDAICLCGMLGAETTSLPEPLSQKVAEFFEANITWLIENLPAAWSKDNKTRRAQQILATLQGAMMLSINLKSASFFDAAATGLMADLRT